MPQNEYCIRFTIRTCTTCIIKRTCNWEVLPSATNARLVNKQRVRKDFWARLHRAKAKFREIRMVNGTDWWRLIRSFSRMKNRGRWVKVWLGRKVWRGCTQEGEFMSRACHDWSIWGPDVGSRLLYIRYQHLLAPFRSRLAKCFISHIFGPWSFRFTCRRLQLILADVFQCGCNIRYQRRNLRYIVQNSTI